MGDTTDSSKKTTASVVGGVVGGTAALGIAYPIAHKQFIEELLDPASEFHLTHGGQYQKEQVKALLQHHGALNALDFIGTTAYTKQILDDAATIAETPDYQPILKDAEHARFGKKYRKLLEGSPVYARREAAENARYALDMLRDDPANMELRFCEKNGEPLAEIGMRHFLESNGTLGEMEYHAIPGLTPPKGFPLRETEGYKHLAIADYAEDIKEHTNWFSEAEKLVAKAQAEIKPLYEKETQRIFRKSLPFGWSLSRLPEETKGGLALVGLGGIIAGVAVARAWVRGKHAVQALAQQDAAADPSASRGV